MKLIRYPGPNATTFIVPGECFPTRYRSTSHGFSAGMGKIGSIIAQAAIAPLRTRGASQKNGASPWQNHVLQIYAFFMFLGIFTTLLIPETKRRTLEEISGEEGQAYHGADENGGPMLVKDGSNGTDEAITKMEPQSETARV